MRSFFILICITFCSSLDLPKEHYEFYFKNNPIHYEQFCANQQVKEFNCSKSIDDLNCWGYEEDRKCRKLTNKYPIIPYCNEKFPNYEDLNKNKRIFYYESDFGYLQKKREELKVYCKPADDQLPLKSLLKCTDYLRYCEGENVFINFRRLNKLKEPLRYRTDILEDGDIGGWNCELDSDLMAKQNEHRSPLQSWYEELEHFNVLNNGTSNKQCDLTINKTIYIMKLDAIHNLYHHFCDFINLYASLHLANDFSLDKQILIWDTYPYRTNFDFTFKAFTAHQLLSLNEFKGKIICFKRVVFPFLPRMIYGLFYNMPLIKGCKRSGLFHAFNRHLLKGLGISKNCKDLFDTGQMIRVTFLSRTTAYRKILNEDELINEIRKQSNNFKITKIDFNQQLSFEKQLQIASRTDILIGIHGAGLTHSLFLPDWAALFELFNCDDDCYKDLARLRGLKYVTWKDKNKLKYIKNEDKSLTTAHLKFTDYQFDKTEFVKRFNIAAKYVKKKKSIQFKQCNENEMYKSVVNNLNSSPKTEL